jgi:mono/diheme cytochrome c family protein
MMIQMWSRLICVCVLAGVFATRGWPGQSDDFFENKIRPILAGNCYSCHTDSRLGGLRLDSRESILKGGKSGPALVSGDPDDSLLIQAVRQTHERLKMPPGKKLADSEIAALAEWIKTGALWPEAVSSAPAVRGKTFVITPENLAYWAFQPVRNPPLPQVKDSSWIQSPIDRFVLSRLETEGMRPVRAADRRTLIRRASFDLIGLPPTPEEVDAFVRDRSPEAFAKVVDRLLASPHYGERWGRHWLDVVRYGEADVRGSVPLGYETYANAFRYRDWVIQAFNQDLPYDQFVKAQLAADLLDEPQRSKMLPGLGLLALGPWYFDLTEPPIARADERQERIDVVSRGFLGVTVACARCHNHKYDPFSSQDYYALGGVFASTNYAEYPLAPEVQVKAYQGHAKKIKGAEDAIKDYLAGQSEQLAEILAHEASRYVAASWKVLGPSKLGAADAAQQDQLDLDLLERWTKYLGRAHKDYPYLNDWHALLSRGGSYEEAKKEGEEFQQTVLSVLAEKKDVDRENDLRLAPFKLKKNSSDSALPNGFESYDEFCPGCDAELRALTREKYVLWTDLFQEHDGPDVGKKEPGVLYYKGESVERFLMGEWRDHLVQLRAELKALEKSKPEQYPFLHGVRDSVRPHDIKTNLRGNPYAQGEEAPRRFPLVLSNGNPILFTSGSGRLQLAEAIARHPLTARVIVNRVWLYHFGRGIVGTPSNFGQAGDRPSHPELLEYLANSFLRDGMSLKKLHREIMLSATYRLSTEYSEENFARDGDNRLLWRANRRRLDAETLRDSLLFAAGDLDLSVGGPSVDLTEDCRRRTVYSKISRFKLDGYLTLFDFPSPSITNEKRDVTLVPLQRLFFMNSGFVRRQAESFAKRIAAETSDEARIRLAYKILYDREPTPEEIEMGREFLTGGGAAMSAPAVWREYAQMLLSTNELAFMN